MFSKIRKFAIKRKIITAIGLVLIIAGGYFGYQKLTKDDNTIRYVTAAVEKGALIIAVSGSGQVSALNQVDIKPEVSGELTAFYISKDQEVKAGQILAEINSKSYQQAVYEAELAFDEAKKKLADLLSLPDEQALRQAELASAQAERDLNKAKETYENIEADAENSLTEAYEEGYNTVADVFLKLSAYMEDLQDVLGTKQYELAHIGGYELILGNQSLFIQRLIDDYNQTTEPFEQNHQFFIAVFQNDNRETIYQLISDTLATTQAISRALDSARHMFDAITAGSAGYKHLSIASHIDKMKPKIESDASAVSTSISSLQRIKETIDDTVKNTPELIEDAKWALQTAQDKSDEKKTALEEIAAGADSNEIKSQENIIAQKEDALLKAKEDLASCSLRAPFDGIVAEIDDRIKKGDSVSANTVLATLITKQKIAEITLNEIDIAQVKTGQKANLTLDAIPELSLTGKVIEVETLGNVAQGLVTYALKIALDTEDERIKTAMTVAADIIVEAKLDALLAPNSAVKYQGEMAYVEMPSELDMPLALANVSGAVFKNPLVSQPVEVGLANDEFTEILSGLEQGDLIVSRAIQAMESQSQTTSGQQNSLFQVPGGSGGFRTGGFR